METKMASYLYENHFENGVVVGVFGDKKTAFWRANTPFGLKGLKYKSVRIGRGDWRDGCRIAANRNHNTLQGGEMRWDVGMTEKKRTAYVAKIQSTFDGMLRRDQERCARAIARDAAAKHK
jgi:hypothetical protein